VTGPFLRAAAGGFDAVELDPLAKGMPALEGPVLLGELGDLGLEALRDVPLPVCVLRRDALEHNLDLMARWCAERGASLAPHGKTTMSPQICWEQMRRGAWAITVANVQQLRALHAFGLRRFVVANQVVDRASLAWLADALAADPGLLVHVLVDSGAGLSLLEEALVAVPGRVRCLVELGFKGGRTGCRSTDEALVLARLVEHSTVVELGGVEAFEGLIPATGDHVASPQVDALLDGLVLLARELAGAGEDGLVVSAGGSAHFDRVVERVGAGDPRLRLVLRSGCYVSHDAGLYERCSPLGGRRAPGDAPRLRNALEVWATVLSRPEPGLALLGAGKRDLSFDVDLPVPLAVRDREGGDPRPPHPAARVVALNDQHAHVQLAPDDPLAVGALVALGVSHPCTTFDRWRVIPVVDDAYGIRTGVVTCF
jgi:D-serine deaminase-like pyridoxal phosphate-dependent protein